MKRINLSQPVPGDVIIRKTALKLIAILVFSVLLLSLSGCASTTSEPLKIDQPKLIHYPSTQLSVFEKTIYKVDGIISCQFNDPNKDAHFLKSLEQIVPPPDATLREMIINNHFGVHISASIPSHPSGSDTFFFPTKNPNICNGLVNVRSFTVNLISCTGDHYPPCWFGYGGLVEHVE